MRYDDFVARVAERGEYPDRVQAEEVVQRVLGVLGELLTVERAEDLAAHLPLPAGVWLTAADPARVPFGLQDFLHRVAEGGTVAPARAARWNAAAVLGTVAVAVPDAELSGLLAGLPAGFAELFEQPGMGGRSFPSAATPLN